MGGRCRLGCYCHKSGFLGDVVLLTGKKILLIITGGIAAYKCLELIRLIKKQGGAVQVVLTKSGAQFVTPLSAGQFER